MKYEGNGYFRAKASLAGDTIPLENVLVVIRGVDEENYGVEYSMITDNDGLTRLLTLPTPIKSLSETSDPSEQPFANYSLEAKIKGFSSITIDSIPVFDGETSFITLNMLPLE